MLKNFRIICAPSLEGAQKAVKELNIRASVEAEYGDYLVEGEEITLAHHGIRSFNPAPCNTCVDPLEDNGEITYILVSHLDLDAVGGVLQLLGVKIDNPEFWKVAEYIDVNGPHHLREFSEEMQDLMNAIESQSRDMPRIEKGEYADVTETLMQWKEQLDVILEFLHPEHERIVEEGRVWAKQNKESVESRLVYEDEYLRVFHDPLNEKGIPCFCNGAYYSKEQDKYVPCCITYSENTKNITLSFEDGGKTFSAREIMQELFGPEAGGHNGIAGGPRGEASLTHDDLRDLFHYMSVLLKEHYKEAHTVIDNSEGVEFN